VEPLLRPEGSKFQSGRGFGRGSERDSESGHLKISNVLISAASHGRIDKKNYERGVYMYVRLAHPIIFLVHRVRKKEARVF